MDDFIQFEVRKLIATLERILHDEHCLAAINRIAKLCIKALQTKNKILLAGNGGSAADAQHLAAELVSRLNYNRPGLAAIALTTDTSALTAIGNDYGYEEVFARQIAAIGNAGDVLIAISTSGKSPNILKALEMAKKLNLVTIGFTGLNHTKMDEYCDTILHVPTHETPKIQECHITFGHIICGIIEETLFGANYNPKSLAVG